MILNRIRNKIKSHKEANDVKKVLRNISMFLQHQGVLMLYVDLPHPGNIKNLSEFELERIKNWSFDLNKYREELPKLKLLYGNDVTQDYILSVFDGGIVVKGEKRRVLLDFQSEHQHIINGRRVTTGCPTQYHNIIYTHGACTWRGTGVEDGQTIASYLQAQINILFNNSYRVVNSAIGRGSDLQDDYQIMLEQTYHTGDIVIFGSHGVADSIKPSFFEKLGIKYISTSSLFDRPHNLGEWFNDDTLHTNHRGNKVISDRIFKELCSLGWLSKEGDFISDSMIQDKNLRTGQKIYGDNPELLKYISEISEHKKGDKTNLCGSIVMNCNPFTLGHRFLIEYAAKRVDYLYIFVVEEDKSFFPFKDRFELVKQGTADLHNVIVLPSGNFIISATTFPGYFYKNDLKDVKIDCSNDINVFAQYIAPSMNITIRFAGEEPLDPITNQYNEGMKELLPRYGIEFRVISRKEDNSGVISASRVRKCLADKNFDELRNIVPETTYRYLVNIYKK